MSRYDVAREGQEVDMCRWMAYVGAPLRTSYLVLHPKHSIVAQSLDSPMGAETVNGDGFGLGWYPLEGGPPAVFRSIEPAWHSENLRDLSSGTTASVFFCHVRAAAGPPIQQTNCHPFRHGNWLFMHNGAIADFASLRRDLMLTIAPELFPSVQGTTDSEVLFTLALGLGLRDDPVGAMARAIGLVEDVGHAHGVEFPFQGTIGASDGQRVWSFRYSTQGQSRTLFHSADVDALRKLFPGPDPLSQLSETAHVVVSEPLSDLAGAFLEVPEGTVAILDTSGYQHEPFAPVTA